MEASSEVGTEMGDVTGYSLKQEAPTPNFEDAMAELDLRSHTFPLSRAISVSSSLYASSEGESQISSLGDSLTLPPAPGGNGDWTEIIDTESRAGEISQQSPTGRTKVVDRGKGWESRPTFFEYVYGA